MELFNTQYRLLFLLCSIIAFIIATLQDVKKKNVKHQMTFVSVFILMLVFLFGLRDEAVGPDTNAYIFQFKNINYLSPDGEIVFYYLTKLLHNFISAQSFLFFIAAVYLGALYFYIKNKEIYVNKFLLFFVFFSMFFFKNLGFNVIRQGVSLMFFLLAYQNYEKNKIKQSIIFIFLSISWHTTTVLAVPLVLLSYRKINLKVLNISYATILLLSAGGLGLLTVMPFLQNFTQYDRRIGSYITNEVNELYTVGFKPQFAFFNTFFLILSYYVKKKIVSKENIEKQKKYNSYIIYFTLSTMLFFLSFQIPYSDRIGLISWIMIPSLLEPMIYRNKSNAYAYATFVWMLSCMLFIVFEFFIN